MAKNTPPCPRCDARMKLELVMLADELVSAAYHCASCTYTLQENFMMSRREAMHTRQAFEKIIADKKQYATYLGDVYSESDSELDL